MPAALNVVIALAPYAFQLLGMIPGFAKTIAQFKEDISGHPDLTAAQKATMLGQAKSDVDAADDEVQAVDVPAPKPTVPS